ncbi:MAG: mechanosensitive ion channel domain-containing protein [Acidobacteriaceae bacterium]
MSAPHAVNSASSKPRIFSRTRLLLLSAVCILLALAVVFSWTTRGASAQLAFLRSQQSSASKSIVSTQPWQTAQALASTAATYQEAQYAREAEQLADHEVDQAFAAALRSADLQMRHRVLTGDALALSQRVDQLQQEIAQDQATVARLKAQAANPATSAKALASAAAGSDDLQVAKAQLGLDTDELTDAQRALDRATGNLSVRIKDELAAHEASMRKYDSQQASGIPLALNRVKNPTTLAGRLQIWLRQRSRLTQLQKARTQALNDARTLTAQYNQLEARANAAALPATAATLAQLQDRRAQRQILFIDEDRIQTDQQLARVYAKWHGQVLLQHGIVLHLLLASFETILAVLLCMILADTIFRHLMSHPSLDRRQTQTLRTILEVSVQLIGLLLIALVVFGVPHQTGTILGLLTAALAISLQDYILSFLGWFMLAGKNGIRVGDMVEINGVCGEVIEIGLLSTTLLETTGLLEKGEPTGRSISFLNSFAIRGTCFNFSTEGQWLWDEITISIPASADIYAIARSVEEAARTETAETARLAEQEWNRNLPSTGLNRISAKPIVMMRPSTPYIDAATSIDLQIRFVTHAVGRYKVRDRLYQHVIQMLQDQKRLIPEPTPNPA